MTTYTYLGYGTTDNNGVAHLNHDAEGNAITHSYTGTGNGKNQIITSLDDEITTDSLISEPYDLWDTLWHDTLTLPTQRTDWTDNYNNMTPTTDGTIITENTNTARTIRANYTATDNTIIEADITGIDITANSTIRWRYKGTDKYLRQALTDNNTHHFKFICNNGTVTTYVDNTEYGTSQTTGTSTAFAITIQNATIQIQNILIYNTPTEET